MRVTAVLVNYNAGPELSRALRSIADELTGQPWEAIVIDNASSDGSSRAVADFAPQARLVANTDNVGFARAANQGLASARADRVLIMNPDCRLVAGAFAAMDAELDAERECALVGPRILNPDGSVQGSARGDPDMLTGLFGRTLAAQRLLPSLPPSRRNVVVAEAIRSAQPSTVVDWLSGACLLARRDALQRVSGFDERYFLYWEDADLCKRLRAAGYRVRYVSGATAVHRVGVAEPDGSRGLDTRIPRQRVPVLRDARDAGRLPPKALDRQGLAGGALLVAPALRLRRRRRQGAGDRAPRRFLTRLSPFPLQYFLHQPGDALGDRQRRRQSRRLDARCLHQARAFVVSGHQEIGEWLVWLERRQQPARRLEKVVHRQTVVLVVVLARRYRAVGPSDTVPWIVLVTCTPRP